MRLHHLLASLVPSALLLDCAAEARASEPSQPMAQATDEASFGTTPARSKGQMQQQVQVAPAPMAAPSKGSSEPRAFPADAPEENEADVMRSSRNAPIATDPPGDWAVLHAGLRPSLHTFGGIATLALAHAR